jgi:hypothetical protein
LSLVKSINVAKQKQSSQQQHQIQQVQQLFLKNFPYWRHGDPLAVFATADPLH